MAPPVVQNGIATGWLPGRLSTDGRRFAAELGVRRRDHRIDAAAIEDVIDAPFVWRPGWEYTLG